MSTDADPQTQPPPPQPSESSPGPISTALPTARPSSCSDYACVYAAEQDESYTPTHDAQADDADVPVRQSGRYDEKAAAIARAHLKRYVDEQPGGQVAVAKQFGVSQPTIGRVLSGHIQPSLKMLMALKKHTGRSLDELTGSTPSTLEPDTKARTRGARGDSRNRRIAQVTAEKVGSTVARICMHQ